jgi:hypothetical protein
VDGFKYGVAFLDGLWDTDDERVRLGDMVRGLYAVCTANADQLAKSVALRYTVRNRVWYSDTDRYNLHNSNTDCFFAADADAERNNLTDSDAKRNGYLDMEFVGVAAADAHVYRHDRSISFLDGHRLRFAHSAAKRHLVGIRHALQVCVRKRFAQRLRHADDDCLCEQFGDRLCISNNLLLRVQQRDADSDGHADIDGLCDTDGH